MKSIAMKLLRGSWITALLVSVSVQAFTSTSPRQQQLHSTTTTPTTTPSSSTSLSSLPPSQGQASRRSFVAGGLVLCDLAAFPGFGSARGSDDALAPGFGLSQLAAPQAESAKLETGLLESRVVSNVLNPPPYGMEGTDIFYPSWFGGSWKVRSETTDVQAPCGVALFGGNSTFQNARKDIGNVLSYDSRFLAESGGGVIADREFNVKSIAKVAMGENSVVDVSTSTPNKFSCVLAPQGSPGFLSVDLIVLNRRQESVGRHRFDCSEVVREIATPTDKPKQQAPAVLKEIETTSLYTYDPEKDEVRCLQRSAAFLLPSNQNEMAMRMWQLSRGRAIDVRFYEVTYTRA